MPLGINYILFEMNLLKKTDLFAGLSFCLCNNSVLLFCVREHKLYAVLLVYLRSAGAIPAWRKAIYLRWARGTP